MQGIYAKPFRIDKIADLVNHRQPKKTGCQAKEWLEREKLLALR
jgi:hypothetical protein